MLLWIYTVGKAFIPVWWAGRVNLERVPFKLHVLWLLYETNENPSHGLIELKNKFAKNLFAKFMAHNIAHYKPSHLDLRCLQNPFSSLKELTLVFPFRCPQTNMTEKVGCYMKTDWSASFPVCCPHEVCYGNKAFNFDEFIVYLRTVLPQRTHSGLPSHPTASAPAANRTSQST